MTKYLQLFLLLGVNVLFAQHSFVVDFSTTISPIKDLTNVNRGETQYLTNGYIDAGISSVRLHDYHGANDYCYYSKFWNYDDSLNQFTTLNPDFDPDNPSDYRWDDYDNTVHELIDNGIAPYIRLGCSYPNTNYILQPMQPPLDSDGINFTKFAQLCKRTVMHTNAGWDNGTYHNIEYWEIWNEPGGLFWDGTPIQFYKMFKTVVDTLNKNFPELKIGGPGTVPLTTFEIRNEYGIKFLEYLRDNNVPLNFYSWHVYGLKNPYALAGIAKKIRTKLDTTGFVDSESHISEINHTLDGAEFAYFDSNSKGTAYYASMLITAQKSSVDKMFWYPGKVFFEEDGTTYSWVGDALKYYNSILKETPIQIHSTGDLIIEDYREIDTTNIMLLTSKSEDEKSLYLLLSNYNSNITNFSISINNLPWQVTDSIKYTQYVTKNPDVRCSERVRFIQGGNSININLLNIPAPAVALVKLENIGTSTEVNKRNNFSNQFRLLQNYPNPFNPSTIIKYSIPTSVNRESLIVSLKVYDVLGEEIATLVNKEQTPGNYQIEFRTDSLPSVSSGIYYYRLKAGSFVRTRKMILIK